MRRLAIAASVAAALALSSVAVAATALSGTYRTKITSNALNGQAKGTWTVTFKNGTDTVVRNGTVKTHGTYSIKGSTITFRAKAGQGHCSTPSAFKIKLTGTKLKLTLVSKPATSTPCKVRDRILGGSFTKVG